MCTEWKTQIPRAREREIIHQMRLSEVKSRELDKNAQQQHWNELHLYLVLKSVNVGIENVYTHTHTLTHAFGAIENDDHYK